MLPPIIKNADKLLHEQIYEFYKNAILNQSLKAGYKMPSHRKLAADLSLSNNTVIKAYEQLILEGYFRSEERRGLFVCELEHIDIKRNKTSAVKFPAKSVLPKIDKIKFNLNGNVVDEKVFPLKEWRKMNQLALDSLFFQYDFTSKHSSLKENLVKYLFYSRGVVATKERIVIGAGMNLLFSLLAIMLKNTHQNILFEEPGYTKARTIFKLHDYKIKSLPVNENGVDITSLRKEKADLLYLTPSHQYPTGAVIPIANRLKILKWASENNAYIIEDDFDCEFQHKLNLIPSLQGIDTFDSVIYLGSFSNAIMPSLRIAYMVLPENFTVLLSAFDFLLNTVPFTSQQTLAYFMERGYYEKHLRKMRKIYSEKYFITIQCIKNIFGNKILFNQNNAGLNILLKVQTQLTEIQLINKAKDKGVLVGSASIYYAEKPAASAFPEILFEFSSLEIENIPIVLDALFKAWFI